MDVEVVVPPTDTVLDYVSLADQKLQLLISPANTHHDAEITDCMESAMAYIHGRSGVLRRSILRTGYRMRIPSFPAGRAIDLPYPPLLSVSSVSYLDTSGVQATLDPASYHVLTGACFGQIALAPGSSWPVVQSRHPAGVSIEFEAGFDPGGAREELPAIRRMIKLLAAHYFENREATINEANGRTMDNRKIAYGVECLVTRLQSPAIYVDAE